MKKHILLIIAVLSCVVMHAAQLTPAQKKAKTEIYNVLKKYGTNISDDGEEFMSFKYNGKTYGVSVDALNPETLYLCLSVYFKLTDEYISEVANIAAFNAASDKPVCSYASNGALSFSCEMYAKEAKPFIAVLPEMILALESSAINFQSEYEKALVSYVPSNISGSFSQESNANEYIFPQFISNGDSRLYVKKVALEPNYTIVDMVSYNGRQYQWCSISKDSYISVNGKRYPLSKADGIAYSPQHTDYPGNESGKDVSLHFRLYFPALPKGTTSFDFSEGIDGWQIKGIELKHGDSHAISANSIETEYHVWDCKEIEVQDGQTILIKTVRSKDDYTFIYSSQDEYIEDADTGRKYYLMNSSIGFEGSPEITHDTREITFYEVYPVLPSNVKRINISSGTQYYIQDFKIR